MSEVVPEKLHRKLASTVIYVTHDRVEAMTQPDRIVIEPLGSEALVFLTVNGADVTAQCRSEDVAKVGKTARFRVDMDKMHPIDPGDGRVLPVGAT